MFMVICLLFGAVLAQRCKILVLVPAITLVSLVAAIIGVREDSTFWHLLGATAADIAAFQVGYLAGLGLRYLSNVLQLTSIWRSSLGGRMSPRNTAN